LIKRLIAGCLLPAALFAGGTVARAAEPAIELDDCRIYAAPGYPGIKARCGVFRRHENPDDPASPMLDLNVAVVPALSLEPEPDPLVPIAGGPGGASTSFYASYAVAFEKVRRKRDILLLDQRGTGQSAPLRCELGDEVMEGQLSPEETAELARECLDSLPYDPRYFTTSVAVEDLEALRVALGYPTLNLYGASYGTRVAQHFARRFPESTRSIILDGVAPPQVALGPDIALEAQKALDAIFSRCAEDEQCSGRFPGLRSSFDALRSRLDAEPVTLSLPHPVTGKTDSVHFGSDELSGAIRMMSYNANTVALMPLMISEAAAGNYRPLAATFIAAMESMTDMLAAGMHNAVVCTEDAPYYGDIDEAALADTYIGPMQTDTLVAICSIWPRGVIDEGFHEPLDTDIPVLLLSGGADPVTPPRFADLAAVDLRNARHLTGKNQGHGLAGEGCMPDIVGQFVDSASVDALDTACMERLFAMPFFLDFSGPAP